MRGLMLILVGSVGCGPANVVDITGADFGEVSSALWVPASTLEEEEMVMMSTAELTCADLEPVYASWVELVTRAWGAAGDPCEDLKFLYERRQVVDVLWPSDSSTLAMASQTRFRRYSDGVGEAGVGLRVDLDPSVQWAEFAAELRGECPGAEPVARPRPSFVGIAGELEASEELIEATTMTSSVTEEYEVLRGELVSGELLGVDGESRSFTATFDARRCAPSSLDAPWVGDWKRQLYEALAED